MRFINQRENLTVETGKIEGMCKIKQTNTVELTEEEQQTIWYDMNSKNRLHQRVPHSIPSPHQTSNARWFVPRVFFPRFCVFFFQYKPRWFWGEGRRWNNALHLDWIRLILIYISIFFWIGSGLNLNLIHWKF